MRRKNTTAIGYINRNNQEVIQKTDKLGTDHLQKVYILRCNECKKEYGANGSDIWQRRCPNAKEICPAGGGKPGIE